MLSFLFFQLMKKAQAQPDSGMTEDIVREVLKTADANDDGTVTASELVSCLITMTPSQVPRLQ